MRRHMANFALETTNREEVMEQQILDLTAQLEELKAGAALTNTMFAETYYYLTIPLMIIHSRGVFGL